MKNLHWLIVLLALTLLTYIETKSVEIPISNTNVRAHGCLRLLTSSTSSQAQTFNEERTFEILEKVRQVFHRVLEKIKGSRFWRFVSRKRKNIPHPVDSDPAEKLRAATDRVAPASSSSIVRFSKSIYKYRGDQSINPLKTTAFTVLLATTRTKHADDIYTFLIQELLTTCNVKKLFQVLYDAELDPTISSTAIALKKALFQEWFPTTDDVTKVSKLYDIFKLDVANPNIFQDPAFDMFIAFVIGAKVSTFKVAGVLLDKSIEKLKTLPEVDVAIDVANAKSHKYDFIVSLLQIESWRRQELDAAGAASKLKLYELDRDSEIKKVKAWATMVSLESEDATTFIKVLKKHMTQDQLKIFLDKTVQDDYYFEDLAEGLAKTSTWWYQPLLDYFEKAYLYTTSKI
ncbi:hypothetical protein CCR75_008860 [Bremia lactucae]|uniref:RxLR effector protein n=1 Tax=Bremia lactucae TaxID=4779 RepID=A0A976FN77_BRELC|nr:hypothetical protein CCR75_008860 [Bremia lactucae]